MKNTSKQIEIVNRKQLSFTTFETIALFDKLTIKFFSVKKSKAFKAPALARYAGHIL